MNFKIFLTDDELKKCKNFAEKSSKTQREYRSGGSQFRNIYKIYYDTLRGKVGEVTAKKFLEQPPLNVEGIKLDFGIYPRGKWDDKDIVINGKNIDVKSAKWFSKWLLLEEKDLKRGDISDYYILSLVSKDYSSANIAGYAEKSMLIGANNQNTLKLKKGENIPNTQTILDADNYAIKKEDLLNNKSNCLLISKKLKSKQKNEN